MINSKMLYKNVAFKILCFPHFAEDAVIRESSRGPPSMAGCSHTGGWMKPGCQGRSSMEMTSVMFLWTAEVSIE
jgi:hypothetical protein